MYFHLFGKRRCKFCTRATKLLDKTELNYIITYMDKAPSVLDDLKQKFEWKTVPIVMEVFDSNNVKFIGGFDNLKEYLDGTQKEEGRGETTDNSQPDTVQA